MCLKLIIVSRITASDLSESHIERYQLAAQNLSRIQYLILSARWAGNQGQRHQFDCSAADLSSIAVAEMWYMVPSGR